MATPKRKRLQEEQQKNEQVQTSTLDEMQEAEAQAETVEASAQPGEREGVGGEPPVQEGVDSSGGTEPSAQGEAGGFEEIVTEYYANGKVYEVDKFADFFETPNDLIKRGDVLGDGKTRERFVVGESSYYAMRVSGELTIGKIDLYEKDGEVIGIYKVYEEPILGLVGQIGEKDSLLFEDVAKGRKLASLLKKIEGAEKVGTIVTDKLLFGHNVENGNPAVKHVSKNRAFVSRAGMKLSESDVNVLKVFKVLINSGVNRIAERAEELIAVLEQDGQKSKILKSYAEEVANLLKRGVESGNFAEVLPQIRTTILRSHAALQKSLMPKDSVVAEIGDEGIKFREQKTGLKTDIEDYKGKVVVFLKIPSSVKETGGYDKLVATGDDLNSLEVNKEGLALLFQTGKIARGIWNMVARPRRDKNNAQVAHKGQFGFDVGVKLLQQAKEELDTYLGSRIYAKEVEDLKEVINRFLSVKSAKDARALYYGENEFGEKVRNLVGNAFESLKVFNSIVDGSFAENYVKEEAEPKNESYLAVKLRGVKFYEEAPSMSAPAVEAKKQQQESVENKGPGQETQSPGSGPRPPKP